MAGTKRKRQKVESASSLAPLGSSPFTLAPDTNAAKDDEEHELESLLFGTPFIPSTAAQKIVVRSNTLGSAEEQLGASSGLDHVLDEDVSTT